MEFASANAADGPIVDDTCLGHAIVDVAAFLDELGMKDPSVAVTMRSPRHDGTGRYLFVLHRGIRSVDVEMPGLPLDEVRCTEDFMPRGCPRLYVDGNSWWWCYALDWVRTALADHDGTIEQRRVLIQRAAEAEFARQPRCPTCGTVRSLTGRTGFYEVRCYACEPEIETRRETSSGFVYRDDGWKRVPHYIVRRQHMPPEVPGHENPMHPDALCGTGRCRRQARHEGRCEPYWTEVERTLVVPERSDA